MAEYWVDDHEVEHLPLFVCREHRTFLTLNTGFVRELLGWAKQGAPLQNYGQIAGAALDGDAKAFEHSDYLLPAKLVLFNPRRIRGAGALPLVTIRVDRRFFGVPASYLRRRIFDDCEQCVEENNPASDHDFADYRPPPGTNVSGPAPGAPPLPEITLEGTGRMPRSPGGAGRPTRGRPPRPGTGPARRPPPRPGPGGSRGPRPRPPRRGPPPGGGRDG